MRGLVYARSVPRRKRWTRVRAWTPKRILKCYVTRLDAVYILWHEARRGWTAEGWFKCGQSPHQAVRFPAVEHPMKKKVVGEKREGQTGQMHLAPIESDVFTRLANVVSHLCLTRYDDGTVRTPGTMLVKTLGSSWVVVLKDPDGCCQMQCLGNTLDDALSLADLLLGSEEAPWEVDQWARQAASKKKK